MHLSDRLAWTVQFQYFCFEHLSLLPCLAKPGCICLLPLPPFFLWLALNGLALGMRGK